MSFIPTSTRSLCSPDAPQIETRTADKAEYCAILCKVHPLCMGISFSAVTSKILCSNINDLTAYFDIFQQ